MLQRRAILRHGLCVFGAGLPLASNAKSALSRFKGSTLRIHYPAHPHFERVERQFARFTELTGIRIEGQRAPYLEMKARQLESLAKPVGDFDLLAYLILWKVEYAQAGHLRPLQPLFADERLALPRFNFDDLIGPCVDAIGSVSAGAGAGGVPGPAAPGVSPGLIGLPCGIGCCPRPPTWPWRAKAACRPGGPPCPIRISAPATRSNRSCATRCARPIPTGAR